MRSLHIIFLATLVTAWTCSLRAGVYNTVESRGTLSDKFKKFQNDLIELRQIGNEEEQSLLHKRTILATQAASNPRAILSVEQRLNLGAYWIRLRKFREKTVKC